MVDYFKLVSEELFNNLKQIKQFIKKHNPTIGLLTEEVVRSFLRKYLPKAISVDQGFILNKENELSRQCDILIYDSHNYAPFYKVNDVVIVPSEAVIAVIEVKTTVTKAVFHNAIDYFKDINKVCLTKTYLFAFNSCTINNISNYLQSYNHKSEYRKFDHDTFNQLPDEIIGLGQSFHLKKDLVVLDKDTIGYSNWYYENEEGTAVDAIETFYLSIYRVVEDYLDLKNDRNTINVNRISYHGDRKLKSIFAIELFDM